MIGVAGRYSAVERGVAHLRAGRFDAFDEPGSLKAVVEFTLTPQDGRADAARLRGARARDRRRHALDARHDLVRRAASALGLAVRRLLDGDPGRGGGRLRRAAR